MTALAQLATGLAGRYDIQREIGAGGMATVYLARDIRHERNVALKVLSPELGAVLGAERFLSEIRVTANLQHPHLLPLFDSGEVNGLLFYVMPFVEGETLRARLEREKQLSIDDAVRITTAVASALEYAHEHGIIHRDLKPENILIQAGQPVIADFGIALAVSKAGGTRVTQTGLSLGTPQYMSPEQAAGDRTIDGRSDIYSLGAVAYEMLAGEPPHSGTSAQAIIAKLMTTPPQPLQSLRNTVPNHISDAVEKALSKLPADRFPDARAFADALRNPGFTSAVRATNAVPLKATRNRIVPWVVAAAGIAFGAWALMRQPASAPPLQLRAHIVLSDSARLRTDVQGQLLALSPDGKSLAYVGGSPTSRIYLRPLDDLTSHPVTGTDGGTNPHFSPDGKWISFNVGSTLKKVPVSGGASIILGENVIWHAWGEGDVIVFSRQQITSGGLWRMTSEGSGVAQVTTPDSALFNHMAPFVLPGGHAVVFTARATLMETDELAVAHLDDGKFERLGIAGSNPRYVASGHLLFGRADGTVFAVPFDLRTLRVTSAPVPVLQGVKVEPGANYGGASAIAVSANGTLVYAAGNSESQLVRVDRTGAVQPFVTELRRYLQPRISPDGKRFAITLQSAQAAPDVWIQDIAEGTLTRVTTDGKSDRPSWTGDGKRIAWHVAVGDRRRDALRWQPWDASAVAETLVEDGITASIAPNGQFLAITALRGSSSNIDIVFLDSSRRRIPDAVKTRVEFNPRVSPDSRWLAFGSTESGRGEVYVQSALGGGGIHQISAEGGAEPVWSPDGHELFYRSSDKMIAATITTEPAFAVVRRQVLFDDQYQRGRIYADYDVMRDGKSFVMIRPVNQHAWPVIVTGWLDELRQRMATVAKK